MAVLTPAGILLGSMALFLTGIVLKRLLAREPDRVIAKLIVLGLLAKLAGTFARSTVMADLYGGRGDFNRYFAEGTALAPMIRSGTLPDQASQTGTPFMDFIAGVVYAVIPDVLALGFVVFGLLSFVGAYLFFAAFRIAVPDGDHRRYAALVFLLPTMVFWPSSIGKEAWLVFTLGLAAYGGARVLRRRWFGFVLLALGGAGVFMVRPHMGALFGLSFAGAYLLRLLDPGVRRGVVAWMLGLVLVGAGAGYAAVNFGDELPQGRDAEGTTIEAITTETERRTTQGGAEFETRPVRSLPDLGRALVTVPFRPFPTEGHNLQAQLAGFEGTAILVLFLLSLPRLASLPSMIFRRPYVAQAAAYSVGFVIAFSHVGNFGILVRQRAQLLPFLLVLLCLPQARAWLSRVRHHGPVLEQVHPADQQPVTQLRSGVPGHADPRAADGQGVELIVDLPAPDSDPPRQPGARER